MLNISVEDIRKLNEMTKDEDKDSLLTLTNKPNVPNDCHIGYSYGDSHFYSLDDVKL